MRIISINQSKCMKCGICLDVCPCSVLSLDENGPKVNEENNCISCWHCVATCPNGAIDNIKSPIVSQADTVDYPIVEAKTAEYFLRSRRSIRCYKNIPVPREKLLELINIAHYAPTASNSQGISYVIVENKNTLEKASKCIYDWMESQLKSPIHWSFSRHVHNYKTTGIDTVLRNAPHLILAIAPKDFKNGRENTISALTYAELYAPAIGLGSCWAGLFEMCAFSNFKPLLSLFNIPEGKIITGAIMVGYPKYKYKKLIDRNPLEFSFD